MFVSPFQLYPANPGWGSWCAYVGLLSWPRSRQSWLRCWGVCVCVPVRLPSRLSWLGCVELLCVLGYRFGLRPAIPGWGFLGVCFCVRAPPVPRQSWLGFVVRVSWFWFWLSPRPCWLGCLGCVFECALRLYPANPGWGVRCGCVCLGSGQLRPNIPSSAVGSCVLVRALPVPRQSWPGTPVCVSGFGFWLSRRQCWLECSGVCVCVRALPVPHKSWLRCVVWVWVLGFGLAAARHLWIGLWGLHVCARPACTPPILSGCTVWLSWSGLWLSARQSWFGCSGVCVFVHVPPV